MPQKPKRKPPPLSNKSELVTLQNAEQHMSQFIKYYKGINLVPEDEWKHFFESMFNPLPFTFRISENHRKMNNALEGKPGTLGQAEVLRDYMRSQILPKMSSVKVDDVDFEVTPLPWYPKQLAWQCNVGWKTLHSVPELKDFLEFVQQEEKCAAVSKQEVASMIPPLVVDINPNHKILEMCCAPGFQTTLIMEQLYSNPKKLPDGFVVANDSEMHKINFRWCQGANVFFTHEDATKFPDLYTTEHASKNGKLYFDRIFLDAPSSYDGLLRKNGEYRSKWNIQQAYKNHKTLKALLHRGVELLELNGQLVYTTHSINPLENEAVVSAILKEAPDALEIIDIRSRLPEFHTRPGMTKWKVMSQGLVFYESFESSPTWFQKENDETLFPPTDEVAGSLNLDRCMRVMPHDNDTAGFFVAVITKIGELPWMREEEPMATESADAANKEVKDVQETKDAKDSNVEETGDAKKEKKKSPYILPIRVDVNVCVSEIEWTVESTTEKLKTTIEKELQNFDLAPMKISKSCVPNWMNKKLEEQAARFEDVVEDNRDWNHIKTMFDIKKFDPLQNMLQYVQDGRPTTYHFFNQSIRNLIKCNPQVAKKRQGAAGGLMMFKGSEVGKPELTLFGFMPILPYANKRLINVTKADLVEIIKNKEVLIPSLSDKLQKELGENVEDGLLYILYEPKGKNPDPKCPILLRREKLKTSLKCANFNKSESFHFLRLCNIDPSDQIVDAVDGEPAE